MQENALELVLQNRKPTEEQAEAIIDESVKHRVFGSQLAAMGIRMLQMCMDDKDFIARLDAKYGYKRAGAYKLARAGKVLLHLSTIVDAASLPRSIMQALRLAGLPEEDQGVAWKELLDVYGVDRITGQIVAEHVASRWQIPAASAAVQKIEQPAVQKVEPVEAELVEDDEPEDGDPDFDEPEDHEEPLPAPAPPARRTFAPHPHFPPFGCERTNRLKLLALGATLMRRVETDAGSIIYQWQESERSEGSWQQLHAGNVRQVDAYWDTLMQSPTAFDA
jgi:hypothetical protein